MITVRNAVSQTNDLHHSPVVTLLIGINDIGLIMNTDRTASQKEQMMREFAAHYNELLDLLTADARQVILIKIVMQRQKWKSESDRELSDNIRHGMDIGNPCLIFFRMWKDKGFHKDYLPGICSEQIQ